MPFSAAVIGIIFGPFVYLALHFTNYDSRYKVQYIDEDVEAENIETPKVSDDIEHAKIPFAL